MDELVRIPLRNLAFGREERALRALEVWCRNMAKMTTYVAKITFILSSNNVIEKSSDSVLRGSYGMEWPLDHQG